MNHEKWRTFFCDAGIPTTDASTYAYKFAHNRIQTNMLVDLNKDYLKEMNITIMGDVIAILKHAKLVYEDFQKTGKNDVYDMSRSKLKDLPSKLKKSSAETQAMKPETPSEKPVAVKRKSGTIPTHSKKEPIKAVKKPKLLTPECDNAEEEELGYVTIDSVKKQSIAKKLSVPVEKRLQNLRLEKRDGPGLDVGVFMSEDDDDDDDNVEVIINDPIVTPYGGYMKFSQDSASYPRFKGDLQIQKSADSAKRTVFKRLGDEISQPSVSSTTVLENDDQFILPSRKLKDDSAKVFSDKKDVFLRLGAKCDVTSTSIDNSDKFISAEKKSTIQFNSKEKKSKPDIAFTARSKQSSIKKIEVTKAAKTDPDACLPASVKSTYTEGILASSAQTRKLTMRERLGIPKTLVRSRSLPDSSSLNDFRTRKLSREKLWDKSLSSSKKRVSFGSVSEKLIPTREEGIRNGELPATISDRPSVFLRLGFNTTY